MLPFSALVSGSSWRCRLRSASELSGKPGPNLKSIIHRCYLQEVAFGRKLIKETIFLPLDCLQGGHSQQAGDAREVVVHVRVGALGVGVRIELALQAPQRLRVERAGGRRVN